MLDILKSLAGNSLPALVVLVILAWLIRETLAAQIKESIATEFKREQELFSNSVKWQNARREKAAQIADLLTAWIALDNENGKDTVEAYLEVQRKYWELALWLDTESLRLLNQALTKQDGAHYKQSLVAVRKLLVEDKDDPITAMELVHFPLPSKRGNRSTA